MKNIFTMVLCIISIQGVLACDVCGGAGSMQGIGFLPNSNYHFIGLTYRARTFATEHPKIWDTDKTVTGKNTFRTTEIWGRYAATERIQLIGFVPYHIRDIADTENDYHLSGLGDVSLLANFLLIKNPRMKGYLGAGVKLPTGSTNVLVNEELIPNLQMGTGSYDALFTGNFTYLKDKLGINSEINYTLTTPTSWDYKYGNQSDATVIAFYKLKKKNTMILPQIGINHARSSKDLISVKREVTEQFSGMNLFSLPIGLDIYKGNMAFRLKYTLPLAGSISEGYVVPKMNAQAQIIYIINKKSSNKDEPIKKTIK